MDIKLHKVGEENWMEITLPGEGETKDVFFGKPGRWHKVNDEMKYLVHNGSIQDLDRIYFVAEAKLVFNNLNQPAGKSTKKRG